MLHSFICHAVYITYIYILIFTSRTYFLTFWWEIDSFTCLASNPSFIMNMSWHNALQLTWIAGECRRQFFFCKLWDEKMHKENSVKSSQNSCTSEPSTLFVCCWMWCPRETISTWWENKSVISKSPEDNKTCHQCLHHRRTELFNREHKHGDDKLKVMNSKIVIHAILYPIGAYMVG